jgi:hypothetical protein
MSTEEKHPHKAFNLNALSRKREQELWQRITEVIPDHPKNGGMYRTLMRQKPGKFERVLADTENAVKEGRVRKTPGAYFMDTWKWFR